VALFAALPVLAGAAAQIPVGALSDKVDRRAVLIGLAVTALIADAAFLVLAPEGRAANLALAAAFGAAIFAMYPVILAHANDHAAPGTFIQVSGGLLMVFGLGSIVGPLVAGSAMTGRAPSLLFAITAASHLGIVLFALWRMACRPDVAQRAKADFVATPPARASTPETALLAAPDAEVEAALAPQAPEDRADAADQDRSGRPEGP